MSRTAAMNEPYLPEQIYGYGPGWSVLEKSFPQTARSTFQYILPN